MIIEQLYTKCLSGAAYFIADDGEAAVVDPLRDIEEYLNLSKKHNATIKYIFITHFHADFISGHLELSKATGATIVFGPLTNALFDFHLAKDLEIFEIGKLSIQVIHTPGHTLESTCYCLKDNNGNPYCLFTGDTLFVGEVGRPDLFSGSLSKEDLAGMLYDSLHDRIKPLEDHILIYPAHGPGSSCGKNIGKETFSTLGEQKANNHALQKQTKEDFITAVTSELPEVHSYFKLNATMNAEGYQSMDEVMKRALVPLSIEKFKEKASIDPVTLLDVREATVFTNGFIPRSINIGMEGRLAEWAGQVLSYKEPILLIAEEGKEEEAITRLARVGFENIIGYLKGGYAAWENAGEEIDMIIDISADEFAMDFPFDEKLQALDVRKLSEYDEAHLENAQHLPLSALNDPLYMAQVDETANIYVFCGGGYRSVIACSLLKKEGFHNLRNILGGFSAMKKIQDFPIIEAAKVQ